MKNFIDKKLQTEIETNCPCTDNYEIENLLDANCDQGFLAYQTIKPPVEIDVKLIFPIRIETIKIAFRIGAQASTGFELRLFDSQKNEFVTVFKTWSIDDTRYNSFTISNAIDPKSNSNLLNFRIPQKFNYLRTNCKRLQLIILKTNKSVPCLRQFQVWGFAKNANDTRIAEILLNQDKINKTAAESDDKKPESLPKPKLDDKLEIPEDFLDAITLELMSTPMTLPSGNTVDQSTLEKHKLIEEMWGRNATDPFTGLEFNRSRLPVLNSALKNRIDFFLLLNANRSETYQLPRTVQSFYNSNAQTVSRRNCDKCYENGRTPLVPPPEQLFKFPCGHFNCRNCLSTNRCTFCALSFNYSQIEKFYQ